MIIIIVGIVIVVLGLHLSISIGQDYSANKDKEAQRVRTQVRQLELEGEEVSSIAYNALERFEKESKRGTIMMFGGSVLSVILGTVVIWKSDKIAEKLVKK